MKWPDELNNTDIVAYSEMVFNNCSNLANATVGTGITMGNGVFNMCDNLIDIYYSGKIEQYKMHLRELF